MHKYSMENKNTNYIYQTTILISLFIIFIWCMKLSAIAQTHPSDATIDSLQISQELAEPIQSSQSTTVSIHIEKETIGYDGTFTYLITGTLLDGTETSTQTTITTSNRYGSITLTVEPGTYYIHELPDNGWNLYENGINKPHCNIIDTTNNSNIIDTIAPNIGMILSTGYQAKCTSSSYIALNDNEGRIVVQQHSINSTFPVTYTLTGADSTKHLFTVTGTTEFVGINLKAISGTATIEQQIPDGTIVLKGDCGGESPSEFTVAEHETTFCDFYVSVEPEPGTFDLTIEKRVPASSGLQDSASFVISSTTMTETAQTTRTIALPEPTASGGYFRQIGTVRFANLPTGKYEVIDMLPPSWEQTTAKCIQSFDFVSIEIEYSSGDIITTLPASKLSCFYSSTQIVPDNQALISFKHVVEGADAVFPLMVSSRGNVTPELSFTKLVTTVNGYGISTSMVPSGTYQIVPTPLVNYTLVNDLWCTIYGNYSRYVDTIRHIDGDNLTTGNSLIEFFEQEEIVLEAGQHLSCEMVSLDQNRPGRLHITNRTNVYPNISTEPIPFTYLITGTSEESTVFTHTETVLMYGSTDQSVTIAVPFGQYEVMEKTDAGWINVKSSCYTNNDRWTRIEPTGGFEISNTHPANCSFTSYPESQNAFLNITTYVSYAEQPFTFTYQITATTAVSGTYTFTETSRGSDPARVSLDIPYGTYHITPILNPDLQLIGPKRCIHWPTPSDSPLETLVSPDTPINIAPANYVNCTYRYVPQTSGMVTLTVNHQPNSHSSDIDDTFTYVAIHSTGTVTQTVSTQDGAGIVAFENLPPGPITLKRYAPDNWQFRDAWCVFDHREFTIESIMSLVQAYHVPAGGTVSCASMANYTPPPIPSALLLVSNAATSISPHIVTLLLLLMSGVTLCYIRWYGTRLNYF